MRCRCLIALLLLCACSVKENRSVCPCELTVRPQEPLPSDGSVLVSVVQDGLVVKQGMLSKEEFESGCCKLSVSRKPTYVTVFAGITSMNPLQGRRLDISNEHQCDEVYSCNSFAELDGDSYEHLVSLHKNFARLKLTVLNVPEDVKMRICGTVRGYDLLDAAPYEGLFACNPEDGENASTARLRLPRQLDEGLSLEIQGSADTLKNIPLGHLISLTGYSFNDEDLLDIAMAVDLDKSLAILNVADWEEKRYPLDM